MTDTSAGKKSMKWLWATLAAVVLVALAAWAFNRSADKSETSEQMASDPISQQDATGVERGEPNVPGVPASELAGGDRGNASAIENAETLRSGTAAAANGATAQSDGIAGTPGQAAPAATGSDARPAGQ